MLRFATLCTAGLLLSLGLSQSSRAQEPASAAQSPAALELKSLRETVQLQQQQLDEINHKLDEVLHQLGAKATAPAPAANEHDAPAPAAAATPAELPKGGASEAPKAQLAEGQTLHVVKKGETLTAIARQSGLTVDELQKANHITDGRRLQIDQNLIIPASTASKPVQPSPAPSAH